ncbi:leucyl aminopeptidase family protein [Novosphingobium album (ex Hu et al. 2023)]|uniref:Leucyl aminopeptidase family protein n=1 Tax=Novosphingobium album (ex Hu et al. 2023) TaxID=2930093 RepID=A0ABT0B092_9SPHN|nr:leucyl aminopeptidase family protein [Novosphingobium album (ex Hu et al. 2023)]MCJ2178359.1 leucyl aminopeptidase family protein [Novosphingobium album (ex Hu et al. 2023)]
MSDKNALIQPDRGQKAIAIHLVDKDGLEAFLKDRPPAQRAALSAHKFAADGYDFAIIPDGEDWAVVSGVANTADLSSWCMAKLAEKLPAGTYRRVGGEPGPAMFGWITGQYRFDRYLSEPDEEGPRILLTGEPKAIEAITAEAEAVMLVRDLVNTPAEDMGPAQLEAEAESLHKAFRSEIRVTRGDMLEREFPMVHAVGRAAARSHAPRMIELEWGDPKHPRIAIIGKGVCFDSGGLDIKPSSGMLLMKKDMGGAAHALALARLIMQEQLPVRLHLLVPAVENAVSGNSFRPGDILKSRAGISVEIGNTDAEGRLILADALARAGESEPELIIDFATLTGAARVAVGPDLPALFTREDATADALLSAGKAADDACWRLPLHDGYREYLKSDVADINNAGTGGFAGASTAALFLDKFVPKGIDWAHFDTFAWRPAAKPGRPKGGAALGLRAAWHMLSTRYGQTGG